MTATQPSFVEPRVDAYIRRHLRGETDVMRRVRETCEREELPAIAPETGRMLQVLVAASGARRVLEVGCLHGYSGLWILTATADVQLESLEIDPGMAAIARDNFEAAGVAERARVHEGDARELLPILRPPFDVAFVDADKENLPAYVRQARRLLRPGGVLAVDNALWRGAVADDAQTDEATRAIRAANEELLGAEDAIGTLLPLGDGLTVAVMRPAQ